MALEWLGSSGPILLGSWRCNCGRRRNRGGNGCNCCGVGWPRSRRRNVLVLHRSESYERVLGRVSLSICHPFAVVPHRRTSERRFTALDVFTGHGKLPPRWSAPLEGDTIRR